MLTLPRPAFCVLLLAAAACRTVESADGRLVTGMWGGIHVGLELGPEGGRLDYDCASGSIDEPLRTGVDGRFAARGTHVPGHGGPEREGYEPPRLPALYSGEVRGGRMTLNVEIPSTGVRIGPLRLRRDAEPIIFRCL